MSTGAAVALVTAVAGLVTAIGTLVSQIRHVKSVTSHPHAHATPTVMDKPAGR
jgi:hypothetical protein